MQMRQARPVVAAVVLLALTGGAVAVAQAEVPEAADAATVGRELAAIRASLDEIAALLREQVVQRRLELRMRRVELAYLRLSPLEHELASVRDQLESAEENRKRIEAQLTEMMRQVDEQDPALGGMEESEILRFTGQLTTELRLMREHESDLRLRVVELENEVAGHREAVRAWLDLVDRELAERSK